MTCRNCGNDIRDDARFCPRCGAVPGGTVEGPQVSAPAWEAPARKKTGLLVAGAAVVVVVIALLVMAVNGMFSDPRKQLGKALDGTMDAFAQAEQALNLPDLSGLVREEGYSQRLSAELTGINSSLVGYDLSGLEGLGLRLFSALDHRDRRLDFELAAYWGEEDLLSLLMMAEDAECHVSFPAFTGDTFYGVNTETLGEDLIALGEDPEKVGDLGFNLFDMIESIVDRNWEEDMEQAGREAGAALWEAVRVKKVGTSTRSINGTETRTTLYQVTIPQEAMEQYVDDRMEALSMRSMVGIYRQMLEAAGMSRAEINRILEDLEELDPYGERAEILKDWLDEVGDLELEVGVSGGRIATVCWEDRIQGSEVTAVLDLGGGESYVDDLSLEVEVDDTRMVFNSTGNHSGKDGEFTDRTTLRVGLVQLTSRFRYDTRSGDLSWDMGIPGSVSLEMEGKLKTGADFMELDLEDISVRAVSMKLFSMNMAWYVGPFEGLTPPASTRMIFQLSEEELEELGVQIQANAQAWQERMQQMFRERLPEELASELLD